MCVCVCRQAAEKHHFLTPDTPIVDTIELPSRLLRDSISGWDSNRSTGQLSTLTVEKLGTSAGNKRNTSKSLEGCQRKRVKDVPIVSGLVQSVDCASKYNPGLKTATRCDSGTSVRKLDSRNNKTQTAPSLNLDPVSMELTCSTNGDTCTDKVHIHVHVYMVYMA